MTTSLRFWKREGGTFLHRGHEVFWRQGGDVNTDTALLLIHGFPTASWDWHAIWEELCTYFPRVIAPDMMGFGFSAKPQDYSYSIFDQADLHESLLKHCGVKRFHVLAHDYGDTVAQELLARHIERQSQSDDSLEIDSCVLLNGGLFPETHRARLIQKLLLTPLGSLISRLMSRKGFDRNFSAIFGAGTQPSEAELDDFWQLVDNNNGRRVMHKLIHYMTERRDNRERWVGALQHTRVPLRVIDGPEDPVSGQHMVDRYRELVPNPDTVILPGIGHYPQVEDPEGTLKAFLEFHSSLGA